MTKTYIKYLLFTILITNSFQSSSEEEKIVIIGTRIEITEISININVSQAVSISEMQSGVGSGGDTEEETRRRCLEKAESNFYLCKSDAQMQHASRIRTNCVLVAGFPVGDGYQACFDVSLAMLIGKILKLIEI